MAGWSVASAGTWAVQPRGAASNSIKLLAAQGIDISAHRARMINEELLQDADLVLCMEIGHVEALHVEFPEYAWKIFTLSETVGKRFSVDDPYGGPIEDFERMVAEVSQLVDEGLPFIIETAGKNARKRWGID
jgi:protein-tyrosine-phosphatase